MTRPTGRGVAAGVGLAALCAVCCPGLVLGALAGIGALSAGGAVFVPGLAAVAAAALAGALVIVRRRRRASSTPPPAPAPVDLPMPLHRGPAADSMDTAGSPDRTSS